MQDRRISTFTKVQGLGWWAVDRPIITQARLENCTFATFSPKIHPAAQAAEQEGKTTTFERRRPFCRFVSIAIGQPVQLDVVNPVTGVSDLSGGRINLILYLGKLVHAPHKGNNHPPTSRETLLSGMFPFCMVST